MGELIRAWDWSSHPLGAPEHWPGPLKTVVRIMLTTQHPVFIFWGPELFCFYNDAYSRSLGPEKHPSALGRPGLEVWPEIWHIIGPQIDQVMAGEGATWNENHLVPIIRHGELQDVYWTYGYSPIDAPDAPKGVGGVLVLCAETTRQVLAELRQRSEADLAKTHIRENHHRVKNNIATIMAMVRLEQRRAEDEKLNLALARIHSRLDSFASLYEVMISSPSAEQINAGDYLSKLCRKLHTLADGANDISLSCRTDLDHVVLPADKVIALGAVAVELVNNAYIHAFAGRRSGEVTVSFKERDQALTLTVCDNGAGKPAHARKESTGIGKQLVELYAASLGARLEEQADDSGTTVRLIIAAQ